jgi:hypothetical protein
MDTKRMERDGFIKKPVVVIIERDCNGKEHIVVIDTMEHAKYYSSGEKRQATMYVKEHIW